MFPALWLPTTISPLCRFIVFRSTQILIDFRLSMIDKRPPRSGAIVHQTTTAWRKSLPVSGGRSRTFSPEVYDENSTEVEPRFSIPVAACSLTATAVGWFSGRNSEVVARIRPSVVGRVASRPLPLLASYPTGALCTSFSFRPDVRLSASRRPRAFIATPGARRTNDHSPYTRRRTPVSDRCGATGSVAWRLVVASCILGIR